MWLMALLSCAPVPSAPAPVVELDTTADSLDIEARTSRVSVALRGVRPTAKELSLVALDPGYLATLVDEWLVDERFGVTVRDLHADLLWMRADARPQWPNEFALADFSQQEVTHSFQEAPLHLVEYIVENDLPYTDVLTADFTLADEVLAAMEGLPFAPGGEPWQVSHHVDGRPQSGLLSSTGLWQRWYTNSSGKHRNRANMVSRVFLCDEIGAFDMPVFPDTDTADNLAIADALREDPGCVVCHASLDPLAAYFWPYDFNISPGDIKDAEADGCGFDEHCYPVTLWVEGRSDNYLNYDLPPPAYYGRPGSDLAHLGTELAADPRFASCAVQTAWTFFTQREVTELPSELLDALTTDFVDSGFDYRGLVRALMLSSDFADGSVPPLQLRPEAYHRLLDELTGFRWEARIGGHGTIEVMQQSRHGLRDLAGGGDHDHVLHNNYMPSPTVLLAWDALTRQAAAHAVDEGEVLLPSLTDPVQVSIQLASLATASLGRRVTSDDLVVKRLRGLFDRALALTGSPEEAWRITLRGLLMDPSVVTY